MLYVIRQNFGSPSWIVLSEAPFNRNRELIEQETNIHYSIYYK